MSPVDVDDPNYLSSFPIGYRFKPRDDELIIHYLKPKIAGKTLPPNRIHEINLSLYSPEQLTAGFEQGSEGEWYFFTPRDKKYKNGERPNRSAGDGYWKAMGTNTHVTHGGERIGSQKELMFYRGDRKHPEKTNWTMHEYVVLDRTPSPSKNRSFDPADMRLDDWVLCRIFQKSENGPSRGHNHRISFPAAVQEANGEQDASSPMEVQSKVQGHGGQRDNGPGEGQNQHGNQVSNRETQSHNFSELHASQIHQPRQQLVSNNDIQQFHSNNPNHGMLPSSVSQDDINGILSELSGIFDELENLPGSDIPDYKFDQGIRRPIISQNNSWQDPNYCGQGNSLDYPFNQLAPHLTTNYGQTLLTHSNPSISHLHPHQIHWNNGLSYFN